MKLCWQYVMEFCLILRVRNKQLTSLREDGKQLLRDLPSLQLLLHSKID